MNISTHIYTYVLTCVYELYVSTVLLQHSSTPCNTLQHTATHCNTLQHTATHRRTLQTKESLPKCRRCSARHCDIMKHAATHCNTLQYRNLLCKNKQVCQNVDGVPATHCNTLQHTATHCNTLQYRDVHCGEKRVCQSVDGAPATHCNPLQPTATQRLTLRRKASLPKCRRCSCHSTICTSAVAADKISLPSLGTSCCSVLQCIVVCCNELQ